uniref:WD repeat-containing protein on Y chromosome n=1 Tax=Anolis carolinensis TaxID=28377 RepID=A0A803T121_ANOCA
IFRSSSEILRSTSMTGGYDPEIRVWNPYVTSSSITQLKGHATAVTNIMINRERTTIVSLSKDKVGACVVWSVPLGNCPISAIYYHIPNNFLVCATYTVSKRNWMKWERRFWEGGEDGKPEQQNQFNFLAWFLPQVVSGCYSGLISVWDILSGQKFMEFATALEQPVEITAMMFDPPERRLITALKNGTIKLWELQQRSLVRETNIDIFLIESKHWKSYHCDDILCMDGHKSKLLATASCNGDIVLWNVHSGQAFCRFNASESPLVLQPKRVLFLKTRERAPDTAILLTSCTDGYIYAWAVGNKGGLMGKFHAAHKPGSSSSSIQSIMSLAFLHLVAMAFPLRQVYQGWVTTLVPPTCLNSWRGHLKNVVSIRYVDRYRSILTASHDCTVKLWMLTGKHIGTAHLFESQYNTENDCVQVNRMGVCFLSSLWIVAYRIPRQHW